MKYQKRFCELFNVPITYFEKFDYYINVLSESHEWYNLKYWVSEFEKFEEHFKNPIEEINSQRAKIISKLGEYNFTIPDHLRSSSQIIRINKNNELEQKSDVFYVSFDLVKANYQTLGCFNNIINNTNNLNKLSPTWEKFCEELSISNIVTESKQIRQEILGHFNPKATSKFQNEVLLDFIKQNNIDLVVHGFSNEKDRLAQREFFAELIQNLLIDLANHEQNQYPSKLFAL
jgi:hypothetical protein